MQIQLVKVSEELFVVVICFKFSNFAYANTVASQRRASGNRLLFALNLVTLLMQIQCLHV